MVSYREALSSAIKQSFCLFLSGASEFNDFYNRLPDFSDPQSRINWFRGAYRFYCDRQPPPPPESLFPQGQCPVRYGFILDYEVSINNQPFQSQRVEASCNPDGSRIFGPVSNFRLVTEGGRIFYAVDAADNNGVRSRVTVSTDFNAEFTLLRNGKITLFRCDGLPDNCGTPAPTPAPDGYNKIDVDIVYNDNDGTVITLPHNIEFTIPIIKNDFSVNIPVRVNFNDPLIEVPIRFTANFNLSTGDITFEIGGDLGGDDRGGGNPTDVDDDDDQPPPPPDAESPDEPEPEDATAEKVISGVLCTTSDIGTRKSVIFTGSGQPDIFVPYLGWVFFRVRTGRTSTAWLKHIPINLTREFIPCPWENGAIGFQVFGAFGSSIDARPVYKLIDKPGGSLTE